MVAAVALAVLAGGCVCDRAKTAAAPAEKAEAVPAAKAEPAPVAVAAPTVEPTPAAAGPAPAAPKGIRVAAAPGPITVDGMLGDWGRITPTFELDSRDQLFAEEAPWQGPEDGSAGVYVARSDENLYVTARVVDDQPVAGDPYDLRSGDAIGFYFSTEEPKWYEGAVRILIRPVADDRETDYGWKGSEIEELDQVKLETKRTRFGYTLEMAIPMTVFKQIVSSAETGTFRLTVMLFDSDMSGAYAVKKTLTLDGKGVDLYETENYPLFILK